MERLAEIRAEEPAGGLGGIEGGLQVGSWHRSGNSWFHGVRGARFFPFSGGRTGG
jgi:hypothetical protein